VLILAGVLLRDQIGLSSAPPPVAPEPAKPQPSSTQAAATGEAERAWAVTKDTASVAVMSDFIRQFGDTPYGSMARARLQELEKSQAAVAPPPSPQGALSRQLPASEDAATRTSASPSFDCAKTHVTEELAICKNGRLSYLDRQLDGLFNALRGRLDRDQQTRLRDEQRAWLKQRAACQSDEPCLITAYETRIAQLRAWR
jgi:uncharacterized protein YecT (DUF1311 family)